jgi:hypothetical protein
MQISYLTSNADITATDSTGRGAYATAWIRRGEMVAIFGGLVADQAEVDRMSRDERSLALQIDERN